MTVCVRACVYVCASILGFLLFGFFEADVCFCVICVCIPSSFGYPCRWLVSWDLVSALSRAPAPTLWWALARFPVPYHSFLPFNPFLYRPCATPLPLSLYDSCIYGFKMLGCVCI